MYHINAVDEVTQWQVVGATEQISEAYLQPVLEAVLAQFPFRIRGFHSDNGSEFINHTVAKLLNKLLPLSARNRDRADQIASAAQQRQRVGGGEKWSRGAEAHGVHAHPGATRSCD